MADALVGLSLPFDSCNIAPTLTGPLTPPPLAAAATTRPRRVQAGATPTREAAPAAGATGWAAHANLCNVCAAELPRRECPTCRTPIVRIEHGSLSAQRTPWRPSRSAAHARDAAHRARRALRGCGYSLWSSKGSAGDARGEAAQRTRRRCWSFQRCEPRSWSKPSTVEAEQIRRVPAPRPPHFRPVVWRSLSLSRSSNSWREVLVAV